MPPPSLAGTVRDSKSQRQERLKSRFRDRGGIFVPSEENALVQILLARGINGESPVKRRASRKSVLTPKPRASAASRAPHTKTPRTTTPKRAARKSAAAPSAGDENYPPQPKKRRNTSKASKLQEDRRRNGMNAGTSAGPSRPRSAAQRRPFADQLADAINCSKARAIPDPCSTLVKVRSAVTATTPSTPPPLGKTEWAHRKAEDVETRLLRYSDEPGPPGREPLYATRTFKSPLFLTLHANNIDVKEMKPPTLRELDESDSGDSDIPLAKKHAKRVRELTNTHAKPRKGNGDAQPPPEKRRSKAKAPDNATNGTEMVESLRKEPRIKEERSVEPEIFPIASRSRTVAPDVDPAPPPPLMRSGGDSGDGKKVQVLREKSAPANAPRKRKQPAKTALDATAKDENENDYPCGPPRKKSRRRVDSTTSRGRKENKAMSSRSAREMARVGMEKALPSPIKQPAARPKSASKAKPSSRARSRGLPREVLRRIKVVNAQTLPALDDVDDDDPIDFLRL